MGFAAHCDWVVGTRRLSFKRTLPSNVAWGMTNRLPRTVFIQTDEQQKFHDQVLPCIPATHQFVLITGDDDKTTPRQLDIRYGGPVLRPGTWDSWLKDSRIKHLFVEHLDIEVASNRVYSNPPRTQSHGISEQ